MKAWRMRGWPSSQARGGLAVVAGQVVGDDHKLAARVVVLDLLQEPLVVGAVVDARAW
jgi:hypothetical protein